MGRWMEALGVRDGRIAKWFGSVCFSLMVLIHPFIWFSFNVYKNKNKIERMESVKWQLWLDCFTSDTMADPVSYRDASFEPRARMASIVARLHASYPSLLYLVAYGSPTARCIVQVLFQTTRPPSFFPLGPPQRIYLASHASDRLVNNGLRLLLDPKSSM